MRLAEVEQLASETGVCCADVTQQEIDGRAVRDTFPNGIRELRRKQSGNASHSAEPQDDPECYRFDKTCSTAGFSVESGEGFIGQLGE
ncbi:hypothetical protein ACWCQW_54915 [Streptomyces mirabilis]